MTADTLIQNFDLIADSPGGVPKLRELILQLAVRGRLVPQEVGSAKGRFQHEGERRKSTIEGPYALPSGWRWTTLRGVSHDLGQKVPDAPFTYVDVSAIDKDHGCIGDGTQVLRPEDAPSRARKIVKRGTVIYSTVRPYLLNIAVVDREFEPGPIVSTAFFVMHPQPEVDGRFMFYYLRSQPFTEYVNGAMTGMAYPAVNDAKMSAGPFPLPPLAEQKRVVAKVDELMKRCDELETRQKEHNDQRTVLTASCLHAVTSTPRNAAAPAIRRTLDNFPLLIDTPESVAELRKTILLLAVQGRLVPQDPNDEPAAALLKRIKPQRVDLPARRSMRQPEPSPIGDANEPPYQVPSTWDWCRLGEVGQTNIGLTYSPRDVSDRGIPVLRAGNIHKDRIDLSDLVRVQTTPKTTVMLQANDILICARSGSASIVGKCAQVGKLTEPMAFGAFMAVFRSPCNDYIRVFLSGPLFRHLLGDVSTTTINQITQSNLKRTLCPLPPLAEQKRIVAKVNELMALCDTLESRLTQSDADANVLACAIVDCMCNDRGATDEMPS